MIGSSSREPETIVDALRDGCKHLDSTGDRRVCLKCRREAADRIVALQGQIPQWLPIETAPRDRSVFFWIVPKRPDEAFVGASGNPIFSTHSPSLHRGKFGSWGSLSKALLWYPEPPLPSDPIAPRPEEAP